MIFTWNGKRFEFITDVLGVAPLGASSGDGNFFPVDHDEYVSIPAEKLKAVDGTYAVRITEELREVSYLDQVKLLSGGSGNFYKRKIPRPALSGVPAVWSARAGLSRARPG
jgi:hypothetical protein